MTAPLKRHGRPAPKSPLAGYREAEFASAPPRRTEPIVAPQRHIVRRKKPCDAAIGADVEFVDMAGGTRRLIRGTIVADPRNDEMRVAVQPDYRTIGGRIPQVLMKDRGKLIAVAVAEPPAPAKVYHRRDWAPKAATVAAVPQIAELRATGLSYTEVAAQLGMTKNRVIGIAGRNGLTEPRPAKLRPAAEVIAFPEREGCLWPHGDPGEVGFHFCGVTKEPGGPYCAEHHDCAYLKGSKAACAAAEIELRGKW